MWSRGFTRILHELVMWQVCTQSTQESDEAMRDSENIQIAYLVKLMAQSEPCLFNNATNNLMPVSVTELDIPLLEENS